MNNRRTQKAILAQVKRAREVADFDRIFGITKGELTTSKNRIDMKEFKGTKGEWYMSNDTGGLQVHSTRFPAGIDIIALMFPQFHDEQTKANAQLIAAAPEMLKALQTIAEYWKTPQKGNLSLNDHVEHSLKLAEKAINKALGL